MPDANSRYSSIAGFVYIFNLIVGAGALTIPRAFSEAGLLISAIIVVILALLSFMTCTFMVEAMSIANAALRKRALENDNSGGQGHENERLLVTNASINIDQSFQLTTKVEMGEMAEMFFNKIGLRLFYLCIVVYLYGDLAIYATAVPKSVQNVACGLNHMKENKSMTNSTDGDQCWGIAPSNVYRIFVAIFAVVICPLAFTNVEKTKYIQYISTCLRWISFGAMIVICFIRLQEHKATGHPSVANFGGLPDLFGASVYSFMCQHSLPSLITPLRNKQNLTKILALDMTVVLLFYSLLAFTALFAFNDSQIEDVYTLSFRGTVNVGVQDFLALYPVFALSASFPVISITLRENLKALFRRDGASYPWVLDRIGFPLMAVLPPLVVAFCTENVKLLVNITGSYAGAGVQYVIPALLLHKARHMARDMFGHDCNNEFSSIFRHRYWLWIILAWTAFSVAVVTAYNIKEHT